MFADGLVMNLAPWKSKMLYAWIKNLERKNKVIFTFPVKYIRKAKIHM